MDLVGPIVVPAQRDERLCEAERSQPTRTRRRPACLLLLIALAASCLSPASASADSPTMTEEHVHVVMNSYITCGPSAVVSGDFDVTRRVTTFYDDGTAIRRVAHISIDGTLTSSLTGAALEYLREGIFAQDLLDGSTVTAGQRTLVVAPGEGIVLQDMGRIVRDAGAIVFEAGPTDLLDYQSGDTRGVEDLCAALGS